MTLPNKLTIGRILVIPAMVIISSITKLNETYIVAPDIKAIYPSTTGPILNAFGFSVANLINLILFILAACTDFLDGYIARKKNQVTTFGKFADPLADKMLVLTSFLILLNQANQAQISSTNLDIVPMWAVAIILVRELMVSGIRLVAAKEGQVIAAGWSGKVKTAFTMVTIIVLFLAGLKNWVAILGLIMMYISVILTIYSGAVYLFNSRKLIFESI